MAGDTLKKVRTGDPLAIPAAAYNAFVDAARGYQSNHRDPTTNQPISSSGTVLIRNDTGEDVPRFGVLGIDRPLIGPGDNEQAFKNRIALSGVKPDVDRHTGRFAILAEPLKKGKIGRAFVTGVCPVKIKMAADSNGSESNVAPSSSEPIPSSSTPESSGASSSVASSSSGSQGSASSSSGRSSASSSASASGGVTSSGSHPQSSGTTGASGSGSSGSGGSGGGGSGGGGSDGSGSGGSPSGSSSGSSSSSGGIPTFWYHLVPCDDDSSAQQNLYIVGNDVPSGDEDCVPRPSSSGATSGLASGSGSGQNSGGGSGGGGSGGSGGGSGASGSGASGSQASGGSGSQLSGASSGQAGSSGSGNQSGSPGQSSGTDYGSSGAGSSGGHGGGASSGSTTAQPVSGPLFLADIADGQTGHLVPCPWGAAAVLWVDDEGAASGSASSDGELRWAIVRLDGGQSVGDPFLAQIELADGSSGNCRSPANWTYNLRSLQGDKLADGVAVLKPRALGRTTPNTMGYGLAVRMLDGDRTTLKLWDAGELHDDGPCEEPSSSSGSSSSSISDTSSGSSASVSSSTADSGASSSASSSVSTSATSSTPPSGSGSGVPSGSASGSGPGSSGSSGGSGGGGSGGGGSGGGGSGGSGSGGSGGGGSGSASGSSSGSSGGTSSSGSASNSPSSSGSPPTTIKYNGICYSVDDSAGYITLPSGAKVIAPEGWWADCQACKATCCKVCEGCLSTDSTIVWDITFNFDDGKTVRCWVNSDDMGPTQCLDYSQAQWGLKPGHKWHRRNADGTTEDIDPNDTNGFVVTIGCETYDSQMNPVPGNFFSFSMNFGYFIGYGLTGLHGYSIKESIPFDGQSVTYSDTLYGNYGGGPFNVTVNATVKIKNNTCCKDDNGNCQNRGQGQTYCDGGCVEEPPLP